MRFFLIFSILAITLFAATIDCTNIFEQRKGELLKEVERVDASRQSFEALKAATNSLFNKQQEKINTQKSDLNATMEKIKQEKADIKNLIKENQKLLDAINGAKNDKISETYSKMKESAAAAIIDALSVDEGASVLFTLSAKKISKIMAKMTPLKASQITNRLRVGPPFIRNDKNSTKAQ